jgi:hypothetical protein
MTAVSVLLGLSLSVPLGAVTPFSMQGHSMMGPSDIHRRAVDRLVDLGIGTMRDECAWTLVEGQPGDLQLPEEWNRNLDYSVSRGLDTLLILDYANPLYDDGLAPHTDEGRAAFARYAEFMARETRGRVRCFEVWNEPNTAGFWAPAANPQDYAALLRTVYPAVKRGNPDAVVVGCATAGIDTEFIRAVLDAGGHDSMDALSIHPYVTPAAPEAADIWNRMRAIRDMTAEYGPPLDIWVTEIGYPTAGANSVSEDQQANMIARTYLRSLTLPWLRTVFWYWFGPDGPDRELNEDNFGLLHHDWSPKPGFTALRTVIEHFASAEFERSLDVGEHIEVHVFSMPPSGEFDHITPLWTWGEVSHLEVSSESEVGVINREGRRLTTTPRNSPLWLDVDGEPLYLLTSGPPLIAEVASPPARLDTQEVVMTRGDGRGLMLRLDPPLQEARLVPVEPSVVQTTERRSEGPRFHATAGSMEIALQAPTDAPLGSWPLRLWVVDPQGGGAARVLAAAEVIPSVRVALTPQLPQPSAWPPATRMVPPRGVATGAEPRVLVSVQSQCDGDVTSVVQVSSEDVAGVVPDQIKLVLGHRQGGEVSFYLLGEMNREGVDEVHARVAIEPDEVVEASRAVAFQTAPRAAREPEIDGDLSDWPHGRIPIRLDSARQLVAKWRPWTGPEDSSARVWTAWDEQNFYVAAEVVDDVIADAVTGEQIYKNDSLEVYFDTDFEGDRDETHYSDDDSHWILALRQGGAVVFNAVTNRESPGGRIAANRAPRVTQAISSEPCAYIIEASIPLSEIHLHPSDGKLIGFNVGLNDDDDPTRVHPFGQDVQLMWSRRPLSWQNPQQFADLFLVGPPPSEEAN